MMWMVHALWLVVAYDLLEYRYVDDVTGNLFTLFCSTWRVVLKMIHWWLWDYFGLKQVKTSKKKLARAIYKEEKWRNGEEKSSLQLKNA